MTQPPILDAEEEQLLGLVPEDGTVGNGRVLQLLGWDADRYFEVRDRLVEKGLLNKGQGRGGSVRRAVHGASRTADRLPRKRSRRERELYAPIVEVLKGRWAKILGHQNFHVEKTASQGKKSTGGTWTRPDITLVAVSTYAYVPGKFMDVITFEVKPEGGWSVTGVFEAASHSRIATRSYLLIHCRKGRKSIAESELERLERLQAECTRFNIGLGLFSNPRSLETFEFLFEPVRREPNPEEMNAFIDKQISAEGRRLISVWK